MSLSQPLPERLRPSELALFVGQSHLAERLTTLLEGPRLPSLLLFGPPGCGKSTLPSCSHAPGAATSCA